MRTNQSAPLQSDINVTPLVDVCLVLLIIFMVVMPVMVSGTPVALPETRHGDAFDESRKPVSIAVKQDGTVTVDTLVIRLDELRPELARIHASTPQRPIAVRADKKVAYGEVAGVLDAARAAGFDDVALVSLKAKD